MKTLAKISLLLNCGWILFFFVMLQMQTTNGELLFLALLVLLTAGINVFLLLSESPPLPFTVGRTLILRAALVLFLLACVSPPWIESRDQNGSTGYHVSRPYGCQFILSPPTSTERNVSYRLDFGQLFVEWLAIATLAAAPYVWNGFKLARGGPTT